MQDKELIQAYSDIIEIINTHISSPRKEKLIAMFDKYQTLLITSPAGRFKFHHGCYPGGYIMHIKKVVECAEYMYKLWELAGGNIDFDIESLYFVALTHDFGKITTGELDSNNEYIPVYDMTSDSWKTKNKQQLYDYNPSIQYMDVPHRSLYLLQKEGIEISEQEWIAIYSHDGMFVGANEVYMHQFNPEKQPRSNLLYIIHMADYMASKVELEIENK